MSKTILIVDDSTTFRQVVRMTLAAAGYDVIEAYDGQNALTKLDGKKVHVIVSDVNMPVMDGISFAKKARELPAYKFTPIIMLTTESTDVKKQEGKAAGVKAWMVKPFQPEQLLMAIKNWQCHSENTMQLEVDNSAGKAKILISGELCIQYVAELMRSIDADWQSWSALELDLGDVTEVDAAGLQSLAQLKRMAVQDQKTMDIVKHSHAVLNGIEMLGLARHFGDPLIIAGNAGARV